MRLVPIKNRVISANLRGLVRKNIRTENLFKTRSTLNYDRLGKKHVSNISHPYSLRLILADLPCCNPN